MGEIFERDIFTRELPTSATHTQLRRFVEPPDMKSPSADQIYRYALFHNVLEPFFVAALGRYLLYVNRPGVRRP